MSSKKASVNKRRASKAKTGADTKAKPARKSAKAVKAAERTRAGASTPTTPSRSRTSLGAAKAPGVPSLVERTTANIAALREQLARSVGKDSKRPSGSDNGRFDEALARLAASYRRLLGDP